MPKHIDEIEITIFDTETTGLKPEEGERIVELAALRVKGKEKIAVFSQLIKQSREISPGAFAVNKITPEMLKDAPAIEAVIPKFLDFIKDSCLCSYNAEFDLNFLNNELKLISMPLINNIIVFDVLAMARVLLPGLTRYALWFVAQNLEVTAVQQHRALSDVEMTWEVFTKLKIICQEKGIVDLVNFSNLFAFKPKL
jgi:DNA polymerase III epsilon subunit family exonuclease